MGHGRDAHATQMFYFQAVSGNTRRLSLLLPVGKISSIACFFLLVESESEPLDMPYHAEPSNEKLPINMRIFPFIIIGKHKISKRNRNTNIQ